jgi:hypothetical protein
VNARVLFTLLASLVLASISSAVVERRIERTYRMPPGARVALDLYHGEIRVQRAEGRDLHVLIEHTIEADDDVAADEKLGQVRLESEQDKEGGVVIRCAFARSFRWSWEKWPPVGTRITALVPDGSELELVAREGGIQVDSLACNVKARALQGRILVGELNGAASLEAAQGDIVLTACTGELRARARGGNILVGRVGDALNAYCDGGAIDIKAAKGAVTAETTSGELRVGLLYPLAAGAELRAKGGDLAVTLDPRASATISADAGAFGKVRVRELPIEIVEGVDGGSKLTAKVGGGGPQLNLRASRGTIRVLGVPQLP